MAKMHRVLTPICNSLNRINAKTALSEQCYGYTMHTMQERERGEGRGKKKCISVGLYKLLCLRAKETAVWLVFQGLIVAQLDI